MSSYDIVVLIQQHTYTQIHLFFIYEVCFKELGLVFSYPSFPCTEKIVLAIFS